MPHYHMRRKDRQITDEAKIRQILKEGRYATIALCRGEEPYVVTLNYGYDEVENCLYFHSALEGLKLVFLRANPNVCATVVEDLGYIYGQCDHKYRSVVIWGQMRPAADLAEKKHGMDILLNHLESDPDGIRRKTLSKEDVYDKMAILRMDIVQMSGKENK